MVEWEKSDSAFAHARDETVRVQRGAPADPFFCDEARGGGLRVPQRLGHILEHDQAYDREQGLQRGAWISKH